MKLTMLLCLLLLPGVAESAQQEHRQSGPRAQVTDLKGTPIGGAQIYVRRIPPGPQEPVQYVGEADRTGALVLPADAFARNVVVFAVGFKPWMGYVAGSAAGTPTLAVHMRLAACRSPDAMCRGDWDVFGPPRPKRKRR